MYSYDRRPWVLLAAVHRLDLSWVEGLRKDFLTLLKNLPKVHDYKTAHELRVALRIYHDNFNELMFEHFLNKKEPSAFGLSEATFQWIDSKLRSDAWAFSAEVYSMPIGFANAYHDEEYNFSQFQREFPQWKTRVQRKAQVFWKEMKEVIDYVETSLKQPLTVKTPAVEKIVLEGFQLVMRGFDSDESDYHEEELGKLKEGLKRYRQRASAVAPILLRKQLPIVCDFKFALDKAGEYNHAGFITIYMSSVISKEPGWVVHMIAHEMGHHLWRTYLGGEAQDFWTQTIRGDFGDLDLKELLDKWPGNTWAFDFPRVLGATDPILALQVSAVREDDLQSKEDFQALYDRGERKLRVPKHPITGYANKNPEEAFCETLGLLVAYGPQTVHERVRWWLDTALPGQVKVARSDHGGDGVTDGLWMPPSRE